MVDKYSYRVRWSEEDEGYISTCLEFPSLSTFGDSYEEALQEIRFVVKESVTWLEEEGEPVPEPLGLRHFKGHISIRVSEELHRDLVIRASEQKVSLNQYIGSKLI